VKAQHGPDIRWIPSSYNMSHPSDLASHLVRDAAAKRELLLTPQSGNGRYNLSTNPLQILLKKGENDGCFPVCSYCLIWEGDVDLDGYSSLSCKSHRCIKTTKKRSRGKHSEKIFRSKCARHSAAVYL